MLYGRATGTFQAPIATAPVITIQSNQTVFSPNGLYKLTMQTVENLVLSKVAKSNSRDTDSPIWASGTFLNPNGLPHQAMM